VADTSRRAILVGLAAAPVTLAPAIAEQASSGELARLIEAHQKAYDAFEDICGREDDMCYAYRQARAAEPEVIVPCLLGGGISTRRGYEDCRNHIEDRFGVQRGSVKELARAGVDRKAAKKMLASLKTKEVENMALLDRLFAEEEAREEAFGLAAMKREHRALNDAEDAAFIAICGYVCQSAEESRRKGEYVARFHKLTGGLQSAHVDALLQSLMSKDVVWSGNSWHP
jgi:hypothetical protein